MRRKDRFDGILRYFRENVPVAESELHFENPFQLICAVVLSAQCTDKRVNMVTPQLFRLYPDAASLAAASPEDVYRVIKSVSYPNSKATHLVGMARQLEERFAGKVPSDIDERMSLPGVGRKTANVVASIIYDKPVIAVPTSIGYGASFHGVSALLTMINSCANGIAVVNIDNGYGAGYMATQINRLGVGHYE